MTSEMFADRFAYAVEVARLRDGLQGTVDELRETNTSNALEDVLDPAGRRDLRQRCPGREATVEEYNDAWAEAYLAMVERDGSPRQGGWPRLLDSGKRFP